MIRVTSEGNFNKTRAFFNRIHSGAIFSNLNRYGQMGIDVLAHATPVDTGLTAHSWGYRIKKDRHGPTIEWYNRNLANDTPVAILIQYGHGTGTGGYVAGRDYINPAIRPIFDQIADSLWKEVMAS